MRLELPNDSPLGTAMDKGLPADWRDNPEVTQHIGNAWIASMSGLGLWVPSFVEPSERNLLVNPAHPDYRSVELHIERHPFEFDPRLFP